MEFEDFEFEFSFSLSSAALIVAAAVPGLLASSAYLLSSRPSSESVRARSALAERVASRAPSDKKLSPEKSLPARLPPPPPPPLLLSPQTLSQALKASTSARWSEREAMACLASFFLARSASERRSPGGKEANKGRPVPSAAAAVSTGPTHWSRHA